MQHDSSVRKRSDKQAKRIALEARTSPQLECLLTISRVPVVLHLSLSLSVSIVCLGLADDGEN